MLDMAFPQLPAGDSGPFDSDDAHDSDELLLLDADLLDEESEPLAEVQALEHALRQALAQRGVAAADSASVVERRANPYRSTFPSEMITCRLDGGRELRLFGKYSAWRGGTGRGHRGGVRYEAHVYERLLGSGSLPAPVCHGVLRDEVMTWLFLEELASLRWIPLYLSAEDDALARAARAFAEMHASSKDPRRSVPELKVYDRAYYAGWARRTLEFAGTEIAELHPWLVRACMGFLEVGIPLLLARPCLIHGELYPVNVLVSDNDVLAVDWEAAAWGAGEIDLASLTEAWRPELRDPAEAAYCQTRWGDEVPDDFEATLAAARVYQQLRWLGESPDEMRANATDDVFALLESAARRLGVL